MYRKRGLFKVIYSYLICDFRNSGYTALALKKPFTSSSGNFVLNS